MTRLIVTADAEADTSEILAHLERQAGTQVAERYAMRFKTTIMRLAE